MYAVAAELGFYYSTEEPDDSIFYQFSSGERAKSMVEDDIEMKREYKLVGQFLSNDNSTYGKFLHLVTIATQYQGEPICSMEYVPSSRMIMPVQARHYNTKRYRMSAEDDTDLRSVAYSFGCSSSKRSSPDLDPATDKLVQYQCFQNGVGALRFTAAHLVSNCDVEDYKKAHPHFKDNDDNKIALSKDLHDLFDTSGNSMAYAPKFSIFPEVTEGVAKWTVHPDDSAYKRVNILIKCFEPDVYEVVCKRTDTFEVKKYGEILRTHLYVRNPNVFVDNLLHKANENEKLYSAARAGAKGRIKTEKQKGKKTKTQKGGKSGPSNR